MTKLAMTTEIAVAYLSGSLKDAVSLKADPHAYIMSHHDTNMGEGKDLKIVENTDSTVHLGLPYYSGLDNIGAAAMGEDALDDVAGGEIWITITVLSQENPELIGLPARDSGTPAK